MANPLLTPPGPSAIPIPLDSSPFKPSKVIPNQCRDPKAESYIAQWEAGLIDFKSIAADDTIPVDQRFCKSMDDDGNVMEAEGCKLTNAPVGYLWKELSDSPTVIGITNGSPSDHNPHYHSQAECYYVVHGKAKTLANNQFEWLKKGEYFYIPGNAIHNTPIIEDEGFGVLYWYPGHAYWSSFKYYWRFDVKNLVVAEQAFDRVDHIRQRDLGLGPYDTNQSRF